MSLPVTRRIARAVLLVAAGTAPVVGAAGSASALSLPSTPAAGLSSQDTSEAVNDATEVGVGATNAIAEGTLRYGLPTIAGSVIPLVQGLQTAPQNPEATGKMVKQHAKENAKKGAAVAKKAAAVGKKSAGVAKHAAPKGAKKAGQKHAQQPAPTNKGGGFMIGGIPLGF